MTTKPMVHYVVEWPQSPTGVTIMSLVDYMESICPDILKPGSKEECIEFSAQYTTEKPYVRRGKIEQEQIAEARKHAGKDLGNVPRNYPLLTNSVMTEEEKIDILNKAFEDAAFLLHAAIVYCGITKSIDANVSIKTGEKYLLTIKRTNETNS